MSPVKIMGALAVLMTAGALEAAQWTTPEVTSVTRSPVAVLTLANGHTLVDFGRNAVGWLSFDAPSTGAYKVILGEALSPDGSVNADIRSGLWNCWYTKVDGVDTSLRSITVETNVTEVGTHRVPMSLPWQKRFDTASFIGTTQGALVPFRYVEVDALPPGVASADLRQQMVVAKGLDLAESSFSCNDAALNRVYELCKWSVYVASYLGYWVDGDRERLPYEADAYISALSAAAAFSDTAVTRRTVEYFFANKYGRGWPMEWNLFMIPLVHADWFFSGDSELAKAHYAQLVPGSTAADHHYAIPEQRQRADGLFAPSETDQPSIVDWPKSFRADYDMVRAGTNSSDNEAGRLMPIDNALVCQQHRDLAALAKALGKTTEAESYAAMAEKIFDSYQTVFFDQAAGLYVDKVHADGTRSTHHSLIANAAALAFDMVPADRLATVADFVATPDAVKGMDCSTYGAQFVLEGLFKAGRADAAIAYMTSRKPHGWLAMLEAGWTTCCETWRITSDGTPDLTHAWSTAPLNVIARHLLGVRPTEPGWAKATIRPQFGGLTQVKGTVPTPKGGITVDFANGELSVSVPDGLPAEVVFAGETKILPAGGTVTIGARTARRSGVTRAQAENRPLRLLVIGNSFSQQVSSGTYGFPEVTRKMGRRIDFAHLYHGGATLQQHWTNRESTSWYTTVSHSFDSKENPFAAGTVGGDSLVNVLAACDWDIISLQQGSTDSPYADRYEPYMGQLMALIAEKAPNAEVKFHQTWAYDRDSTILSGHPFGGNVAEREWMYDGIRAAVDSVAETYGLAVVATGYAAQLYRYRLPVRTFAEDPCFGDHRHFSDEGKYLELLTWCQHYYGEMPDKSLLSGLPLDAHEAMMRDCARVAGSATDFSNYGQGTVDFTWTATLKNDDGTLLGTLTATNGTSYVVVDPTDPDGRTFAGWRVGDATAVASSDAVSSLKVYDDLMLTAVWREGPIDRTGRTPTAFGWETALTVGEDTARVLAFTNTCSEGHVWTVPEGVTAADVLLVGGGGGGGYSGTVNWGAGGGGAGAVRLLENLAFAPGSKVRIVIGAGGAGATATAVPGGAGGDTSLTCGATVYLVGGGGGGVGGGNIAGSGGCGGGTSLGGTAGLGSDFGGAGGIGNNKTGAGSTARFGGGGGGAAPANGGEPFAVKNGSTIVSSNGGTGGAGLACAITGEAVTFGGGGGGGASSTSHLGGSGGAGGGGNGGGVTRATDGCDGLGGGGGGMCARADAPGRGGSGIVIIRYVTGSDGEGPSVDPETPPVQPPVDEEAEVDISVDTTGAKGRVLTNPESSLTFWGGPSQAHEYPAFCRWAQSFCATGGSASRDLFRNPDDRTVRDDYDYDKLVNICRSIRDSGLKPYIKLGNVPLKLSSGPSMSKSYEVNVRPPDDDDAYYRYMKGAAQALVDAFGVAEVRTWRFSVFTEANNLSWFAAADGSTDEVKRATKEAFFRIYDYTTKAFTEVVGEDVLIGTHLFATKSESRASFTHREFIDHCRNGANAATGGTGAPLKLLAFSYYFNHPDDDDLQAGITEDFAIFRAALDAAGFTEAIVSVDEGRVYQGKNLGDKKTSLPTRAVGMSWQAVFDFRLAKTLWENGGDCFATWGALSGEETLYEGFETVVSRTGSELARFEGLRMLPTPRVTAKLTAQEAVDAVAAVDDAGGLVRVAASRFRDKLEFDASATASFKVTLPPAMRGRTVFLSLVTIDDTNNWFADWIHGLGTNGFTAEDIYCNRYDQSPLLGLWADESKARFQRELAPLYQAQTRRVRPKVQKIEVPEDGEVSIPFTFIGNAVVFASLSLDEIEVVGPEEEEPPPPVDDPVIAPIEDWGYAKRMKIGRTEYQLLVFTNTSEAIEWHLPSNVTSLDCLVVGGGGAGGHGKANSGGGGGGAGGVRRASLTVSPGATFAVRVGSGGVAVADAKVRGMSGGASSLTIDGITLTVLGGGGGAGSDFIPEAGDTGGASGGSGGGGTGNTSAGANKAGGAGSPDGCAGGAGANSGAKRSGGGGGGAGTPGASPSSQADLGGYVGGAGGTGVESTLSGETVVYGGGGAGGTSSYNEAAAQGVSGGAGGGGRGGGFDPDLGIFVGGADGADGLGGGGGGGSGKSSAYSAGSGGNGLVLLRYARKPLFVITIR